MLFFRGPKTVVPWMIDYVKSFLMLVLFSASIVSLRQSKEKKASTGILKEVVPPDPYHLVHIIFFFFGLGTELPMSFFLTAQQVSYCF